MPDPRSRRPSLHLLLLLPLALLPACDVEAEPEAFPAETPPPAPEEAPPVSGPPDPELEHAVISLEPVDDSGVAGEALAMHEGDAVVLILEVTGLPGAGEYPAHIHEGDCARGGPVAVTLSPVAGGPDGSGSSTTAMDASELDPNRPLFVQVHGEGGAPIACGNIVGHG